MALNPKLIQFFIDRIAKSEIKTFGSEVAQLFQYLSIEVKDNPIFQKYNDETIEWEALINNIASRNWYLPSDFDKAKSFAYSLYQEVSKHKEKGHNIAFKLIRKANYNECINQFNNTLLEYLSKALEDIIRANPELEIEKLDNVIGNTVFIIHGHNNLMKTEVQLLLERAGVRNIVLHELPDKGRTIIDKLVEESVSSNYAIALFSPDDVVENGSKRARQNVILELGYFMGKLGKERLRMLVNDNIEIPSDLSGILYEKYDATGAWKMKILKELQAVGIFVDFNSVIEKL